MSNTSPQPSGDDENMDDALDELREFDLFLEVASERALTDDPVRITVREMLRRIGQARRGPRVVRRLEGVLAEAGLRTDPPFTETWIDNPITFLPATPRLPSQSGELPAAVEIGMKVASLPSADTEVISVCPNDTIEMAISLMQLHDYSQLAVMTSPHNLKGAITWESVATSRHFQTREVTLSDSIVPHPLVVRYDEELIRVIPLIANPGFAFVRDMRDAISGIITTADLSERFGQLAQPFLALEELEKRLRIIIDHHFSMDQIEAAVDPGDQRTIDTVDDLTLGEVQRLLESPDNFERLGWPVDRKVFVKALQGVCQIRNDLVHFSPDPLEEPQMNLLYGFVRWLRMLGQE
jgi:CBS domain-containing protein